MSEEENLRTPLSLLLKSITTHVFALATYTYTSKLLRRPTSTRMQALRVLFFFFVPTLPLVELITSTIHALIQFIRNFEDDEDTHVRFYLSAALGMHANLSQDDDAEKKDTKDKTMHLLSVGSHCAEKHVMPMDWAWLGKLFAMLFSMTQAIGTIVMWVRRVSTRHPRPLAFDHRNGAMGIASTICGTMCLCALVLRLRWKVSKVFEVKEGVREYRINQKAQFLIDAMLAILLHTAIATIPNSRNEFLYWSVGAVFFLLSGGRLWYHSWQTVMLLVFIYIFRNDIMRRFGLGDEFLTKYVGPRRSKRAWALLELLLILVITADVLRLFIINIVEFVEKAQIGDSWVWWQDPLSDELIVI
ncbi:hypothetical protein EJ04DRAFT_513163 [Polyplosphaeria fusca]|uniref:Uncharacterized protein n=1 Tax=Polyplosphaeria fusca TaxID=682080 RepID=A0A9P4QW28_9PLEO|nr:hypothetical protein EJ04DRAFT_513163 [Polyplosphaeria fusca]